MRLFRSEYRYKFLSDDKLGEVLLSDDNLWVDEVESISLSRSLWSYGMKASLERKIKSFKNELMHGDHSICSGFKERKITLTAQYFADEDLKTVDTGVMGGGERVSYHELLSRLTNFCNPDRLRLTLDGERYVNCNCLKVQGETVFGSGGRAWKIKIELICLDPIFYSMPRRYSWIAPDSSSVECVSEGNIPAFPHWTLSTTTASPRKWQMGFAGGFFKYFESSSSGGIYDLNYDALNSLVYRTHRSDPAYIGKNQLLYLDQITKCQGNCPMNLKPGSTTVTKSNFVGWARFYWRDRWTI